MWLNTENSRTNVTIFLCTSGPSTTAEFGKLSPTLTSLLSEWPDFYIQSASVEENTSRLQCKQQCVHFSAGTEVQRSALLPNNITSLNLSAVFWVEFGCFLCARFCPQPQKLHVYWLRDWLKLVMEKCDVQWSRKMTASTAWSSQWSQISGASTAAKLS